MPFGKRKLLGIVTQLKSGNTEKLKSIESAPSDLQPLTAEMLKLVKWISEYYLCSEGEVIKAIFPAGTLRSSQWIVYRTLSNSGYHPSERQKEILQILELQGSLSLKKLSKALDIEVSLSELKRLESAGLVELKPEIVDLTSTGRFEAFARLAHKIEEQDIESLRGKKQQAILRSLSELPDGEDIPVRDLLERSGAARPSLNVLAENGLVHVVKKEVIRTPFGDTVLGPVEREDLRASEDQSHAITEIMDSVKAGKDDTFLLHGVTGSGKTFVYLSILEEVLKQGKTAIVLIPEIALTPQTVRRFWSWFGDQIAVLHSRMSDGERYDAWRHLQTGRFKVAIGPRSAILAPLDNLGLIIVDEEHEASYKQSDPAPRYNARDLAVMRAKMNGAVCVLGSATPSLESWHNAISKKYRLLSLPSRIKIDKERDGSLAEIRLVNLSVFSKQGSMMGQISPVLKSAIDERLSKGQQSILLQNRRGYSPRVQCKNCAEVIECPNCSVSLTYHSRDATLRCHYCGHNEKPPKVCPHCHTAALDVPGAGTQRIELQLTKLFPKARIGRLDADSTTKKNAHFDILEAFRKHELDVLVGTQMVAKGLDFENVTLVGIVNADTGLYFPDFRASERTFQLLTQVAGRSGRGKYQGEVILQTNNPGDPTIRFSTKQDFLGFAKMELDNRQATGYPPFGKMIAVEFKGPDLQRVIQTADQWTKTIGVLLPDGVELLGPAEAFLARIKNTYRYQTFIKVPDSISYRMVKQTILNRAPKLSAGVKTDRINIDIDAINLL